MNRANTVMLVAGLMLLAGAFALVVWAQDRRHKDDYDCSIAVLNGGQCSITPLWPAYVIGGAGLVLIVAFFVTRARSTRSGPTSTP